MPRLIPPCPLEIPAPNTVRLFEEPLDIHVVTPIFGGGVVAGQNDPVTVIRGTTIRGHLRFWWRATRGAAFSNVQALKARESEIWGSASCPGQVHVRVKILTSGQTMRWANFPPNGNTPIPEPNFPAYVLFPFAGRREHGQVIEQPAQCTSGVCFQLTFSIRDNHLQAELKKEVEAALWAWINFGGVGARTRRGCGSLYCAKYSPAQEHIPNQQY